MSLLLQGKGHNEGLSKLFLSLQGKGHKRDNSHYLLQKKGHKRDNSHYLFCVPSFARNTGYTIQDTRYTIRGFYFYSTFYLVIPFFKRKIYIFRFFIEKEPEPLCVLLNKEETDKKQRKV